MSVYDPVGNWAFRPSSPGNVWSLTCHDDLACSELLRCKVSQFGSSSNLLLEDQIYATEQAATNLFQEASESMWSFSDDSFHPSWESDFSSYDLPHSTQQAVMPIGSFSERNARAKINYDINGPDNQEASPQFNSPRLQPLPCSDIELCGVPPNDILRNHNLQKPAHDNKRVKRGNAHNLIERRYRENLNALFSQLRNTLGPIAGESSGPKGVHRSNKASTLNLAREEILELRQELRSVKQRLRTLAEVTLSIEPR